MEQNISQDQDNEFTKNSKNILAIILSIVITALLVGGGIYVWASYSAKNVKYNLQNEIDRLNTELSENIQKRNELQGRLEELQNQINLQQTEIMAKETEIKKDNKTSWNLVSGNPEDFCFTPTWNGQAEVKGWYTLEKIYGGGKDWRLNVIKEDYWKMPISMKDAVYKLLNAPPELEEKLKNATQSQPVTLIIRGYYMYCEGDPRVNLNEF